MPHESTVQHEDSDDDSNPTSGSLKAVHSRSQELLLDSKDTGVSTKYLSHLLGNKKSVGTQCLEICFCQFPYYRHIEMVAELNLVK